MKITKTDTKCSGFKLEIHDNQSKAVGRAFLYIMYNDLNDRPFGLMEDVYVDESVRGQGIGTQLINKVIEMAKNQRCYKLIATSRHSRTKVHKLYHNLGFADHGKEFRIDF